MVSGAIHHVNILRFEHLVDHRLICGDSKVGVKLHVLTSLYFCAALDESKLKTATWNIAAVNNNPFEYWVKHEDASYNTLMQGVESFIEQPGERDVPVSQVFTPAMWAELKALMMTQGWDVSATEQLW